MVLEGEHQDKIKSPAYYVSALTLTYFSSPVTMSDPSQDQGSRYIQMLPILYIKDLRAEQI